MLPELASAPAALLHGISAALASSTARAADYRPQGHPHPFARTAQQRVALTHRAFDPRAHPENGGTDHLSGRHHLCRLRVDLV